MKLTPNFYRDRVCLNVLAGSKDNASEIYEAAEGHVLVGVLSKNYPDVASAVADMREYAKLIDNALSVGLGAGDPNQSAMVSEISRQVQPQHVNQVFTGVAPAARCSGRTRPWSTAWSRRPARRDGEDLHRPAEQRRGGRHCAAGNRHRAAERYGRQLHQILPDGRPEAPRRVRSGGQACARHDFWLEPTGGIDLENYSEILQIALDAGVSKIIPHIYSSIIDKASGNTRPADVRQLLEMTKVSQIGCCPPHALLWETRAETPTEPSRSHHAHRSSPACCFTSLLAAAAAAQTHYAWVGTYNPNGEGLYRFTVDGKPARCAIRRWSARCRTSRSSPSRGWQNAVCRQRSGKGWCRRGALKQR
jgi:hypothetical protein